MNFLKELWKTFSPSAGAYVEVEIPPVRIWSFDPLQLLDLRGLDDPEEALGRGVRVAVEMCRTIPHPHQRGVYFSPRATEALLALDPSRLRELVRALRTGLPLRNRDPGADLYERGRGELAVLVAPEQMKRNPTWESLGLTTAPNRGEGAGDLDAKIGAALRKSYEIQHPRRAPDLVHIDGIPGVGMHWDDERFFDQRRAMGSGSIGLAVSFLAARLANERLPVTPVRTWILAPWMLGRDASTALVEATPRAREAIASRPPTRCDQVAFDADPPRELREWVASLGLTVTDAPRRVTEGLALPYPQLTQHFMLAYAAQS